MGIDLTLGENPRPDALQTRTYLNEAGSRGVSNDRYRTLERRQLFQECKEYEHQAVDWSGYPADALETISPAVQPPDGFHTTTVTPVDNVRMKRPTAPLRLAPTIVSRFTGLLFSQKRKPEVVVEGDEQSEDFLKAVFKASKFWACMHTARTFGGSMGSALISFSLEDGRFSFTAHNPKTVAEIVFEDAARTVCRGVLIQYVVSESFDDLDEKTNRPKGTQSERQFLYRRIIDSEWDLVFKKAQIVAGRMPAEMEPDLDLSMRHDFGFCPARWVQNIPALDEGIDGLPDPLGAYQLFDTIDRLNSQANRGLLANMDPTLVITPDPKLAKLAANGQGKIEKGSDNALNVGPAGDAKYLEISAGGIDSGRSFATDLKSDALDAASCVIVDPEKVVAAAQSAKAIELVYAPMLEKADVLREQWGDAIEQIGTLVLEAARLWMDPARYPGRTKVSFKLPPRIVEHDHNPDNPDAEPEREERLRFPGPEGSVVSCTWPAYFSPTPQDVQILTATIAAAYAANLIDQETAVKLIAPLFQVKDWKAMLRKVQEQEKQKREQAMQAAGLYGDDGGLPLGEPMEAPTRLPKVHPQQLPKPAELPAPAAGQGGRP